MLRFLKGMSKTLPKNFQVGILGIPDITVMYSKLTNLELSKVILWWFHDLVEFTASRMLGCSKGNLYFQFWLVYFWICSPIMYYFTFNKVVFSESQLYSQCISGEIFEFDTILLIWSSAFYFLIGFHPIF